jgi:hypothetical protein
MASVVVIDGAGHEQRSEADARGAFSVVISGPPPFTVLASAPGFASAVVTVDAADQRVLVSFDTSRVEEQVTVTSMLSRAAIVTSSTRTATPALQVPQSIDVVDQSACARRARPRCRTR